MTDIAAAGLSLDAPKCSSYDSETKATCVRRPAAPCVTCRLGAGVVGISLLLCRCVVCKAKSTHKSLPNFCASHGYQKKEKFGGTKVRCPSGIRFCD